MTSGRRDGLGTPFGRWLRDNPCLDSREFCLSIIDCDFWDHNFSPRKEWSISPAKRIVERLQLIEVKTFEASIPFAQRDTLNVVDLLLRGATVRNGRRFSKTIPDSRRPSSARAIQWFGVHVLQLSNDRPDNSDRIIWDGHDITEESLVSLIRFDRDPDHPTRLLDTRRHHLRPVREIHPDLLVFPKERAG